jgi:hypothetical protein
MSTTYPEISNEAGAELLNAAFNILAASHGLFFKDYNGNDDKIVSEWTDTPQASAAGQTAEAQALYDAALGGVCKWLGISDRAGFRRYLAQFTQRPKREPGGGQG